MEEAAKERFADIECHPSVTDVLDYTVGENKELNLNYYTN
jgi:hypothetical protein